MGARVGGEVTEGADLDFFEPPLPPFPPFPLSGGLLGARLTDGIADGDSVIGSGLLLLGERVGLGGFVGKIIGELEGSEETDGA